MSYRIYLGITKKNKLNDYLKRTEDDFFEFIDECRDVELHDELDIDRFTVIDKFKEDEYVPYILDKEDFQYILDYYKKLIKENYEEKEKIKPEEYNEDIRNNLNVHLMYHHIVTYFKTLIIRDINIESFGLFLFDYFYLVKLYENLKEDECVIITHG